MGNEFGANELHLGLGKGLFKRGNWSEHTVDPVSGKVEAKVSKTAVVLAGDLHGAGSNKKDAHNPMMARARGRGAHWHMPIPYRTSALS